MAEAIQQVEHIWFYKVNLKNNKNVFELWRKHSTNFLFDQVNYVHF